MYFHSVPGAVQGLNLAVNDDNLTVTWTAPTVLNGDVSYNVTLSGINLVDNSPINIISYISTVTDTIYTVAHSSLPYSNYTAVVVAFTGAGASEQRAVSVQTAEEGKNTKAVYLK